MADPTLDVFWHDDVLLHDTGSGVFEHDPSPLIEIKAIHGSAELPTRSTSGRFAHLAGED